MSRGGREGQQVAHGGHSERQEHAPLLCLCVFAIMGRVIVVGARHPVLRCSKQHSSSKYAQQQQAAPERDPDSPCYSF